jgi:hypothetical protein
MSSRGASSSSPLSEWVGAFLDSTFAKLALLYSTGAATSLALHDPLCIWHVLAPKPLTLTPAAEDVRVETVGQWTRGMCVVDRRARVKRSKEAVAERLLPGGDGASASASAEGGRRGSSSSGQLQGDLDFDEVPGDSGNWLREDAGNAVWRAVDSPWKETFGMEMLRRIFGDDH